VPSNIEHRTAADAAPAISRPRLGLSSGSLYPDIATEEVPAVAARLGLPDIELMLQTAGEYDPAFMREVARNCRAAGCRVHAIHVMQSLHPVFDPYPRRVREGRALFARAIEGAAALGARALVWHGPRQEELRTPERWARFIEIAAELAEECGAVGVTLALENVSWCALPTVRDVAAFAARMEELRTTHVGFAFDPFQAAEAGANPFMILAAMEGRVADVHLSDWREHDPAARHLPPGEGDLPWPALLRAIVGSGYRGPLLIEAAIGDEPDTIRRVQERLTPLLALATAGAPDARCGGEPPPGVREGIRLFNAREFYECHEVIEHEWHAERGEIRLLYQGILQIGVGFYHALHGNHRGATLLLTDGIAKTERFVPTCLGIDTARLVAESRACLTRVEALGPARLGEFDPAMIPAIRCRDGGAGSEG